MESYLLKSPAAFVCLLFVMTFCSPAILSAQQNAVGTHKLDTVALIVSGPDRPLIFAGTGRKSIRVSIAGKNPGAVALPAGELKVELRAYDDVVEVSEKIVSKIQLHVSGIGPQAASDIEVPLPLTNPGLYEATVTLLAQSGDVLAQKKVTLASVPPRTEVGPSDFGVCTHFASEKAEREPGMMPAVLDLVKLAGFSHIRDEMYWGNIERTAGKFEFPARIDAYLNAASERGLSPLVALNYSNARVHPEAFGTKRDFPSTPAAVELYARYAAECVKRYGDTVKQWEVWNEPHAFGKASHDEYTRLLIATYAAIKKADNTAQVIGCGGGGAGGGPGGDYVFNLIKRGGLESMDGFSIHPYMSPHSPDRGYPARTSPISGKRVSVPTVWMHLQNLIDRNRKAGGAPLSLWVTEIGWYSTTNLPFLKGETMQAAYFARTYLLARRYRTAQAVFWYDFRNDGFLETNREHNFGLITNDYQPKPSYVAAAVLTWTLGGRPWTESIAENDTVKAFQFGSGNDALRVGWAVSDPEVLFIKPQPGTYILRNWQGRDKEISITSTGYEWRLNRLPSYLFSKNIQ